MTISRLKIDLLAGNVEIEGEEALVRGVYEDFRERLIALSAIEGAQTRVQSEGASKKRQSAKVAKTGAKSKGSPKGRGSYGFVKDLDLSSRNGQPALKTFFAEKGPSSAMEKNVCFVYYLERMSKVGGITINHIYTCYKHVGVPVPGALRQSLLDTAHLKGWIDTKSMDDIKLAIHGENYVEHDLPKKAKAATSK